MALHTRASRFCLLLDGPAYASDGVGFLVGGAGLQLGLGIPTDHSEAHHVGLVPEGGEAAERHRLHVPALAHEEDHGRPAGRQLRQVRPAKEHVDRQADRSGDVALRVLFRGTDVDDEVPAPPRVDALPHLGRGDDARHPLRPLEEPGELLARRAIAGA